MASHSPRVTRDKLIRCFAVDFFAGHLKAKPRCVHFENVKWQTTAQHECFILLFATLFTEKALLSFFNKWSVLN